MVDVALEAVGDSSLVCVPWLVQRSSALWIVLLGPCAVRDRKCHYNNNNGNLNSAGIRHVVALMALLHHCVHQTHIKHHAKTILLMLIKRYFRLIKNLII